MAIARLHGGPLDGQVIPLPTGTYDELSILATAHNGDVQKEGTLAYNDGTTVQVPLRFTDWAVTPKFGEEIAIDMPYRHNGGGDTSPRVMIFTQRIPLEASLCKLFGLEAVGRVTDRGLLVHGGIGYTRKLPIERLYRDARLNWLEEGPPTIQYLVAARELTDGYHWADAFAGADHEPSNG